MNIEITDPDVIFSELPLLACNYDCGYMESFKDKNSRSVHGIDFDVNGNYTIGFKSSGGGNDPYYFYNSKTGKITPTPTTASVSAATLPIFSPDNLFNNKYIFPKLVDPGSHAAVSGPKIQLCMYRLPDHSKYTNLNRTNVCILSGTFVFSGGEFMNGTPVFGPHITYQDNNYWGSIAAVDLDAALSENIIQNYFISINSESNTFNIAVNTSDLFSLDNTLDAAFFNGTNIEDEATVRIWQVSADNDIVYNLNYDNYINIFNEIGINIKNLPLQSTDLAMYLFEIIIFLEDK